MSRTPLYWNWIKNSTTAWTSFLTGSSEISMILKKKKKITVKVGVFFNIKKKQTRNSIIFWYFAHMNGETMHDSSVWIFTRELFQLTEVLNSIPLIHSIVFDSENGINVYGLYCYTIWNCFNWLLLSVLRMYYCH